MIQRWWLPEKTIQIFNKESIKKVIKKVIKQHYIKYHLNTEKEAHLDFTTLNNLTSVSLLAF